SCSTNKLEWDDDSKKNHPALEPPGEIAFHGMVPHAVGELARVGDADRDVGRDAKVEPALDEGGVANDGQARDGESDPRGLELEEIGRRQGSERTLPGHGNARGEQHAVGEYPGGGSARAERRVAEVVLGRQTGERRNAAGLGKPPGVEM